MENSEFLEAVEAYLDGTADSWQEFIVEDYFDSFSLCFDILDLLGESEIKEVGDRVLSEIMKNIKD